MGKKGTSVNIQAISGSYMILTTLCANTEDRIAAVRSDAKTITDTISDAAVDVQTKEALTDTVNTIVSTWDTVGVKFKAIQRIVNEVLGKVMEAEQRARAGMASGKESLDKTRSNMSKL